MIAERDSKHWFFSKFYYLIVAEPKFCTYTPQVQDTKAVKTPLTLRYNTVSTNHEMKHSGDGNFNCSISES
jgi:hypothetical protein